MQIIISSEHGPIKWDLTITPIKTPNPNKPGNKTKAPGFTKHWEISETRIENSLFSNPLAKGKTCGECLDNFLAIENQLLNSL